MDDVWDNDGTAAQSMRVADQGSGGTVKVLVRGGVPLGMVTSPFCFSLSSCVLALFA